jgi:isopentenyl-diphosphate delta-isomerase
MGGHVESGETYEFSFKRELMEELNIDANTTAWKLLGHLTPQKDEVSAFMNVYEIHTDMAPKFNTDDFIEFFWLSPDELLAQIEQGAKTKGDLPKLVKRFYFSEA